MNAKKKTGLGRGLSALLEDANPNSPPADDRQGNPAGWSQAVIAISAIESNPYQPRTDFEETALIELSASIREQGIIQPITVRKKGKNKYQLIAGERRLRASSMAGLTEIPAFVRTADDNQMLEMALVENIQRKDLNSIEVAISFQRMMDELEYTQESLADKVGKNRSTITNYLRLLRLPPDVQIALRDDMITMGHARALINLEDVDTQLAILKNILSKGLSVREVERIVQDINKPRPAPAAANTPVPPHLREMAQDLEKKLGGKISVKRNPKGKGSISLPFQSDRQLEEIIRLLV